MALYEYQIGGTDRRYEVLHSGMRELRTWRELADAGCCILLKTERSLGGRFGNYC